MELNRFVVQVLRFYFGSFLHRHHCEFKTTSLKLLQKKQFVRELMVHLVTMVQLSNLINWANMKKNNQDQGPVKRHALFRVHIV